MGSKYYISVSDLSEYLEGLIKKDPFLNEVDIEGEISGLQIKSQVFFNLKDDKSIIRCVIFDDCLKVLMINYKNGESVKLSGVLNVYKAAGNYQIIVKEIEKSGIGNIYKKVFELKEKISEEKYVDITECLIILTILSNKSGKIQKILGNLEKMKGLRYYSTSIIPEKERVFLKSLNIDILYNI